MDTDQPINRALTFPLPKRLRLVAAKNVQTRTGPSGRQIPGPIDIPCGLPPLYSHDAFHTMCKTVARPDVPNAPITKYFRHTGSGVLDLD